MKVPEFIRLLEKEGWRQVWQRGSHRQFRPPDVRVVDALVEGRGGPTGDGSDGWSFNSLQCLVLPDGLAPSAPGGVARSWIAARSTGSRRVSRSSVVLRTVSPTGTPWPS